MKRIEQVMSFFKLRELEREGGVPEGRWIMIIHQLKAVPQLLSYLTVGFALVLIFGWIGTAPRGHPEPARARGLSSISGSCWRAGQS